MKSSKVPNSIPTKSAQFAELLIYPLGSIINNVTQGWYNSKFK